jgi:hypothetical protein
MIEKITYIAFDGEEFEAEEDCVAHEKSLSETNEHVRLFAADFSPIKWNPENYDGMWAYLSYIVIEPHYEEEAEEWWNNTFCAMLDVSPFSNLDHIWSDWLRTDHGDEPTILAYDFNNDDDWVILNKIYSRVHNAIKSLNLVDALS